MTNAADDRSPTIRLAVAVGMACALVVPLLFVWMLIQDRETQSQVAQSSIAEGWGGPQLMAGPVLAIPYRVTRRDTTSQDGAAPAGEAEAWEERTIAPEAVELATILHPDRRTRSIYEAIVYEAETAGRARFVMPPDLAREGLDPARLNLARAELRFGLSDPRGLGANPAVSANGQALRLQPGAGRSGGGRGFFAPLDASALAAGSIKVRFAFRLRGNGALSLAPRAGDTRWTVTSSWPHPSFRGGFLPARRDVGDDGFRADYQVGNLALGQSLVTAGGSVLPAEPPADERRGLSDGRDGAAPEASAMRIDLVQPVDLYSQVDRASKYGFLFIGFTFLALLMFDIVGGVHVQAAEYLLVGAGLVLFFVLLLAFAEVIGFGPAYLVASGAITLLIAFYSAAVLRSRRRAAVVASLMAGLYGTLYLLLSLEALSLLIGSVMLFAALAAVMYLTRNLNWGGEPAAEVAPTKEAPAH